MFIAKKDEKLDQDDNTTTFAQTHDTQMTESIGFPSNTVPEETTIDDIKNTALDDEEFLVSFDQTYSLSDYKLGNYDTDDLSKQYLNNIHMKNIIHLNIEAKINL